MMGCDTIGGNGGAMIGSGITFVPGPIVGRILVMQACHELVAMRFSEYRSGGNVAETTVSLDKCGERHLTPRAELIAVNYYRTGSNGKKIKSTVHGGDGSLKNVDTVNFSRLNHCDSPSYGVLLNDRAQSVSASL